VSIVIPGLGKFLSFVSGDMGPEGGEGCFFELQATGLMRINSFRECSFPVGFDILPVSENLIKDFIKALDKEKFITVKPSTESEDQGMNYTRLSLLTSKGKYSLEEDFQNMIKPILLEYIIRAAGFNIKEFKNREDFQKKASATVLTLSEPGNFVTSFSLRLYKNAYSIIQSGNEFIIIKEINPGFNEQVKNEIKKIMQTNPVNNESPQYEIAISTFEQKYVYKISKEKAFNKLLSLLIKIRSQTEAEGIVYELIEFKFIMRL